MPPSPTAVHRDVSPEGRRVVSPTGKGSLGRSGSILKSTLDPQVALIQQDPQLRSLLDVVCDELLETRNQERPTVSRIAFVGDKEEAIRTFFEDLVTKAAQFVNSSDPKGGKTSTGETVGVSGIVIEMQTHFFAMLEGEPEHLLQCMKELHQRLVAKKFVGIKDVSIIFQTDDIVVKKWPRLAFLEASIGGTLPEKPLEELIVDAVHGVVELGTSMPEGKMQIDNFLNSVKGTYAHLLPKATLPQRCMESELCLTLEEYLSVFGDVPEVVRPSETVHPVEPALQY